MKDRTKTIKKLMVDAEITQMDIARNLKVSFQRVSQVVTFQRVAGKGVEYIRNGIFHALKSALAENSPSYEELWENELPKASNE